MRKISKTLLLIIISLTISGLLLPGCLLRDVQPGNQNNDRVSGSSDKPALTLTNTPASLPPEINTPLSPVVTEPTENVQAVNDPPSETPTSIKLAINDLAARLGVDRDDILIANTKIISSDASSLKCVQIYAVEQPPAKKLDSLLLILDHHGTQYRYNISAQEVSYCGSMMDR